MKNAANIWTEHVGVVNLKAVVAVSVYELITNRDINFQEVSIYIM